MKLQARQIAAFLRSPDPAVRAVLVYGPDSGLVRERAALLAAHVVDDPADPFRVAELSAAQLKADPARLADEAAAIALTGGRRVIRVREDGETIPPEPFAGWLDGGPGDGYVVVEAGDLAARSPLRKLFEGARDAAALPCYADEAESLDRLIESVLKAAGLRADRDALAYLSGHLGSDRAITRSELDKLVLYKGDDRGTITLEDVEAVVGDSASIDVETAVFAAAEGDHGALDRALVRLYQEGLNPVGALRIAQAHFQRLHLAAGAMEQGASAGDAVGALRPPVFFKAKPRLTRQLGLWSRPRIARALEVLMEAEADTKRTGMPGEAICARALFTLANAAKAARERRR